MNGRENVRDNAQERARKERAREESARERAAGGTHRAVVVGTGDMARLHLNGYARAAGVTVAGIVGRTEHKARRLAQEYDVPAVYATVAAALEAEAVEGRRVDIASVCLPTYLHAPTAVELLEAGVHVLTEKPVALTLEDADRMSAAAEKTGRQLCVVFNRRFASGYAEVAAHLPALGEPPVYRADDLRKIRPKRAMHDTTQNGGPFIDCACHDFDLLLHHFGAAESVYATGHVFATADEVGIPRDRIAVDTGSVSLRFRSGATAEVFYSWGLPPHNAYWIRRVFMGPGGVIAAHGDFGDTVEYYRRDGIKEVMGPFPADGHDRQIAAFVEAVRSGAPAPVPPEDGIRALRLSLLALESMRTGRVMEVT
ncbi:MAG: Gfo/Idh/MocA family protein [Spirochaetota bacterium]